MKFILSVLIAISFAGSSSGEPSLSKSRKVLVAQDESGRTIILMKDMADWSALTTSYISRYARLPKELRENGPWGDFEVKIKFRASPEGEVSDVQIKDGSGNSQIDAHALETVKSMKLLPFTQDMGKARRGFVLPINIKNDRPVTPGNSE